MRFKSFIFCLSSILILIGTDAFAQTKPNEKLELKTTRDSASYAIGILTAYSNLMQLKTNYGGTFLDYELLAKGFHDVSIYPFRVTAREYPISDDLDKDVKSEFGNDWVTADWNQIKQMDFDHLVIFLTVALQDTNQNITILRDGEKFNNKESKVQYFIEYTNYKKPTLYGALDNVEKYMITLGRAKDMKLKVLAFNPNYAKVCMIAFGFTKGDSIINSYFAKVSENEALRDLEAGNAFLRENGKKPGIITTKSGLQYEIIVAGSGRKPMETDKVKVNYKGILIDGTEFDSTTQRGGPAEFPVNSVIKGWTEALQMMPVGSKWKIYVPSNIAYGERGVGRRIKPNSALIFEIELLDIL
jgi:FKBP-type peptidyl-prolyl cis-trans isomerase